MKARAPPPPQAPLPAPRHIFKNTDGRGTSGIEAKENMLKPTVEFELILPQGYKVPVTEEGSKALMDLLVELCSRYHLNPALHTLELLSPEGHPLGFKPNVLLGSLNVACVLIKEKVWEEKVVRKPAPKVPEKTVRLMVNYHRSQKAVLRVNPLLTLQALTPVICDKCELNPAHVLLLKDSISRHELPLDKSLAELGIKELYVHDKSLVLQPKMASAPALNYSDSFCSSTTSLGRTEKKGLLGIFQFNRKKSKTETSSVDMDQCDDKVIQNTDTHPNGLSTMTSVHNIEGQPSTLSQSQSVMNMSRMSPMAEMKKRRAPAPPEAPTPSMGHSRFEGYQMGLDSETQQRKRKAPAPPPTPASITPGCDDTSASAAPTLASHAETPTTGFGTKVADSVPVSSTIVIMQTIKPVPKKKASQPAPLTTSSPAPSWSTTSSQAVQDSSSDLSHSLDDSDVDLDQAGSNCSTLTSSTASGSVRVHPNLKSSSCKVKETEKSNSMAAKPNQEVTSDSSSKSDTESAVNLKLDEVENKRHSAMGVTVQPAPPKPRRSPARDSPQRALTPTPTTSSPPSPPIQLTEINPQESPMEAEEAAQQSWLNSVRSMAASDQKVKSETPEEETMSLGSSSGNSSLPDQGYAASEGLAECEDSGIVSSPSDTQPTSPDGSLSLDGSSGGRGRRLLGTIRDNSSDSDEGCATWGSRHRCKDISLQSKSGRLKDSYEVDPELRAQLHQTLADFEADLAGHIDIVSVRETSYTMSTHRNDVPVSVVDMDVPVTAIDEVLEDYESNFVENKARSITRPESTGRKAVGSCHQSSTEPQNKNNNACTAADSSKSSSASTKQPPQPDQHEKPLVNKSIRDIEKETILEANRKVPSVTDINIVKEDKQRTTSAVKSDVDIKKHRKSTEDKPAPVKSNTKSFQEKKPVSPQASQRSVSTERTEEMRTVNQNNPSSNTSHGKITCNAVSRFGMRTFTVVPPKPAVMHVATGNSAVTVTAGAIKIDEQGNMVKVGISKDRVGGSAQSGMNCSEGSPLGGKAKAFWSSSQEKEDNSKSQTNKAKVNVDGLKSSPSSISDTTKKTSNTENLQTTKNIQYIPAGSAQSKEQVKEKAKEHVKDIHTEKEEEVERKTSVSKIIQQPNNKPALPATLFPDLNRDPHFLKPSRRTSSHYVASAINKYTPKTSAKTDSIPTIHDSSVSVKTQAVGLQRSGRSVQVNPHQSSPSSLSDNKENESASKPNPSGPKRSISYPEYVSDSQRDPGEVRPGRGAFGSDVGSTKGSSNALETETAKNKRIQSSGPTQTNVTANNGRDNLKDIRPRSPSPAHSPYSSAKPPTTSKTSIPSTTKDATKVVTNPTVDARPQPSVTVSDSDDISQPVTVFGPVKKFRPVICKSVEKETSLHSSLMEAIQTGGGRDRLKKISTSGSSDMKKIPYVEEQNERSALLAAIRGQSSSSRLRKTTSEAADELMKFKMASSEEKRSADPPTSLSPSLTSTSSSAFNHQPPTPPPVPMVAPPPPPPVWPQGKPSTVAHPSANTAMNPALAREAMMEAIRSGTAAERLKKVAAPTKTVQVNGRLGTIQANSSALPQQ